MNRRSFDSTFCEGMLGSAAEGWLHGSEILFKCHVWSGCLIQLALVMVGWLSGCVLMSHETVPFSTPLPCFPSAWENLRADSTLPAHCSAETQGEAHVVFVVFFYHLC